MPAGEIGEIEAEDKLGTGVKGIWLTMPGSVGPTDGAPSAVMTVRRQPEHAKSHPGVKGHQQPTVFMVSS